MKNYTQFPDKFVKYPSHRAMTIFNNISDFENCITAIKESGYNSEEFYILHGEEGIKKLDPNGESGLGAAIARSIQKMSLSQTGDYLNQVVDALKNGSITLSVPVKNDDEKEAVFDLMKLHNGIHIKYFASLYIEEGSI